MEVLLGFLYTDTFDLIAIKNVVKLNCGVYVIEY